MKNIFKYFFLLLIIGSSSFVFAQEKKQISKSESEIMVEGTSTLHDWEIDVEEFSGSAEFEINDDDLKVIKSNLSVIVKSMKSGKSSMDDIVYEAMEEEDYPTIKFDYVKTEKITKTSSGYQLVILGHLSINKEKKLIRTTIDINKDGSKITVEGSVKFKMSTFGIDPPTAMFGTVKSGDLVTIKFKLIYK